MNDLIGIDLLCAGILIGVLIMWAVKEYARAALVANWKREHKHNMEYYERWVASIRQAHRLDCNVASEIHRDTLTKLDELMTPGIVDELFPKLRDAAKHKD